ncbi:hypothetical protein [Arabidopsis thaliana]|uniref:Transmembrane protein n=1 Tax=Arabidopsis thaliana TaxID=3702 RepID=Q9SUN2_ARATH|nr:uncharacterized protein AT4G20470 [Arabidopsis thaliana]AEE84336.1 transmembrane protein [Arabidopsis thaliana]CAB45813.1 hypothetical protein [Arabidopsis thaliana]CAB79047.1 hypothetical protein [Arabidopsis thaliana]|eukprot:NP_193780.1 transmembrane protein [Arabidopsis thaliana]
MYKNTWGFKNNLVKVEGLVCKFFISIKRKELNRRKEERVVTRSRSCGFVLHCTFLLLSSLLTFFFFFRFSSIFSLSLFFSFSQKSLLRSCLSLNNVAPFSISTITQLFFFLLSLNSCFPKFSGTLSYLCLDSSYLPNSLT